MRGNGGAEPALGRFAASWIEGAASAPRAALALLSAALVAAIVAAAGTRVDTDSSGMLSRDLTFQERAREIVEAFPSVKNSIVVVVRSSHRDAADAATAQVAESLEQGAPGVGRVFAPAVDPFFMRNGLLYLDLETLESRLSRVSQASNLIATLREDRTSDGFLRALDQAATLAARAELAPETLTPLLVSAARVLESEETGAPTPFDWQGAFSDAAEDETLRVVTVEPALDFGRLNPARAAMDSVAEAVAAVDPGTAALVEIGVTGDPVLRAEELRSVTARLGLSFGLSLALVAVVLAVSLRGWGRVALALGCVLATVALTAGVARLFGPLNLISVAFVVLMVGLGIDFAIHLLAYLDERMRAGGTARAALASAGPEIGGALALSAATTAVAFLAFTGTDFVGMAQLGAIGAVGVLLALAVAFTAIPAAVALRPRLARGGGRGPATPRAPRRRLRRTAAWTAAGIGAAAVLVAPQARFDSDPMNLRDPAAPSVVAHEWLAGDPDRAPLRLSLIVDEASQAAEAAARLEALPEVRGAAWLGALAPKDQEAKLDLIDLAWPGLSHAVEGEPVEIVAAGEGPLAARIAALGTPEAEALAAELAAWDVRRTPEREAALSAALFRYFPDLIDRLATQLGAGPVSVEDLPDALADRYRAADGRLRIEIVPRDDISDPQARAVFVDAVSAAAPEAGGPPAQVAGASRAVSAAMLQAVAAAFAGTALLAWLALRRARPVAAILVPLAFAGAATLAASALLDMPFNYANVVVLPLMIGIGVDAGVHLTMRSVRGEADVFATSTPRAALASALTTIAAFGTLALSAHPGTASMGKMLALSLAISLAMVFALAPALARPR